ncbi:MAG: STAS domain-containing protein [Verrucomicrobiales bacterium]|nr:STAS domain-containing protein [Verrucomicrobiales bacterium]
MKTQTTGDVLRVTDIDRLSAANSNHFKHLVRAQLTPQHQTVEVDLSAVSFVDSEGLGALAGIYRSLAEKGGRLRLLSPQPSVRHFLELVQFHRILEIHP